ncbi:MAG: sugar ABC transporter permease [Acidobacteriota bacterium]
MTSESRAACFFLLPAVLVIALFFVLPVGAALVLSLTDFDLYALGNFGNIRFIFLDNYRQLLTNPIFWKALRNTFYFALIGGPLTLGVALGAALMVNSKVARLKGLFRTIYFAPVVTTIVAVAVVWRYLYHPKFGLFNIMLHSVGLGPIDWLGSPHWAMLAIIFLAVWKNFGYTMIIFVAGLQTIPEDLYEAARIDGANAWKQFIHVTVPMLAPTFLFVGIVTAIGYLQLFAEPYVMTPEGGPSDSTLSVVMHMYLQGFRWWNMGYAAAVAFVLFVVIAAATAIQLKLQNRGHA